MSRWDSRTVPASARRAGRDEAAGGMVSWAYAGMVISAFPARNRRPRLPHVLNDALDVTIVPPGPPPGVRPGHDRKRTVTITFRDSRPDEARAGCSGAGAGPGQGRELGGGGLGVGGGPGAPLPAAGTPQAVAVGPDGQVGGDRDDGEFLRGRGDDAGDTAGGQ